MAIDDNLDPNNEEEDTNVFSDVLAAPFRGVEGAIQGVYNLADYVTGDFLPDYDRRFLGKSRSAAGNVVEDITQFATGFIPVVGWLGKAGKISKARKLFGDDVARQLAYGGELTAKQAAKLGKAGQGLGTSLKAGMVTDFLVFDGQEERLSNFLYQYPTFQNPVTEYLQATKDDSEIEGRFKNAIEGMFLELGIGALILDPFIKSVKMIKNRSKKVAEGKPKTQAQEEAFEESDLTQEELFNIDVAEGKPKETPKADTKEAPKVKEEEGQLSLDLDDEPIEAARKYNTKTEEGANKMTNFVVKNLKAGGEQALRSSVRLVADEGDLVTLAKAVSIEQELASKEAGEFLKTSKEALLEDAEDIASALGGNTNDIERQLQKLQKSGESFEKFSKDQMAVRYLNNVIARKTYDLAEKTRGLTKGTDEYEKNFADVLFHMDLLNASQNLWAQFGRTGSLTLLQRKYIYGQIKPKKIDALSDEISIQDIHKFRDKRIGTMKDEKLLNLIVNSKTSDDIQVGLNKVAKGTSGGNMMDMAQEYWINSVMSSPTTQFVNLIGSAITYAIDTVEKTIGSALTGNFALTKSTLHYAFNAQAISESFRLAKRVMKTGEAISIPEARVFDDSTVKREAIKYTPVDGQNAFSATFNFLGELVRAPSRGLMMGDEFFKAFNYRTYVSTELSAEAIAKGLKGKERAKYVADRMSGYITETGRIYNETGIMRDILTKADEAGLKFDQRQAFIEKEFAKAKSEPFVLPDGTELDFESRGAIASRAEQMAKVNTHTQDSNNGIALFLTDYTRRVPVLKFVFPFVRTPTNILTYGVKRSPLGTLSDLRMLSSRYRQTLASGSPTEVAQAYGKMATSVSSLAALMYFMQSGDGHKRITGAGPDDIEQKKTWEMDNQEYSIKVGDKWVSYNRLDPIATILGMVADMNEASVYNDIDSNDFAEVFSTVALAISNNVTNKSYVQGMSNLFEFVKFKNPEKDANKFLGSIAGGFVPNIINQSMSYEEDRPLREARTILDRIIKRTPFEGKLAPRRDVLGRIQTVPSSGGLSGVINPIYIKENAKNMVDEELANLGVAFKNPSSFLRPGVEELDMRENYNPETGQQVYDRFLELVGTSKLRGKTLEERLEIMFKSPEYKNLKQDEDLKEMTGYDSPQVKAIRRLIGAYRGIAKAQALKENPELQRKYLEAIQMKREAYNR